MLLVPRDSGTNIVMGMRFTELPDLSCTAHILQLVVNDGLASQRAIIDVIAILKKCATHFHHSILAKQRLQDIQREPGLPEHSIIQTDQRFTCYKECLNKSVHLPSTVVNMEVLQAPLLTTADPLQWWRKNKGRF